MKKEIKKYGNSAVIVLTKEDLKLNRLSIGNIIDITVKKELKGGKK